MRKVALVFVLAVLAPSLVLAWLAVRSLRDQQFLLERQQSLLYQTVTDSLAKSITDYIAEQQREFNSRVEAFAEGKNPRAIAARFDPQIRTNWPLAEVGFCVTLSGNLICPTCVPPFNTPELRAFCVDNSAFLANREVAEVYWNASIGNAGKGNEQTSFRNDVNLGANNGSLNSIGQQSQQKGSFTKQILSYGSNYSPDQVQQPAQQSLANNSSIDNQAGQNVASYKPFSRAVNPQKNSYKDASVNSAPVQQ